MVKLDMTGEMMKPKNAELGEDYWKDKGSAWGSAIGDEGLLIRPNYPDLFELSDQLKAIGIPNEVLPFDVYQGPYISVHPGLNIWYSDDYPFRRWLIRGCTISPYGTIDVVVCDDTEALDVVSRLVPLVCLCEL